MLATLFYIHYQNYQMKINDNIEITNEDNMLLMARYPDKYFDLAVVDPPYGIKRFSVNHNRKEGSKYRKSMQKICDNAHRFNNEKPKPEYWNELKRISKAQIIWGANNFNLPETEYFLIWNKEQTVENFASAELAFVYGIKKPAKVFTYQIHKHNSQKTTNHSSEKPVSLYEFIFKYYAQKDFKIIDTHLGSGNIAKAIDKMNKIDKMNLSLVACEIDTDYFNDSIKNIKLETANLSLF